MAIYSVQLKYISRRGSGQNGQSKARQLSRGQTGRCAVAAAAYAAGVRLTDERTGRTFDFSAKSGVYQSFIVGGGGWGGDTNRRAELWNAAEAAEGVRCNARTAREWVIALPHELSHEQREALARSLAQSMCERWGVVVDCSIHMPSKDGDQRNFHAHFLMTSRSVNKDGSFGAKTILDRWEGKKSLADFRQDVAAHINAHLAAAGVGARVDHRTLKEQGIKRTPQIHEGVNATNARRRNYKNKDELQGKETRHQKNEKAGVLTVQEYHEALRLLQEQRRANDRELAALTAQKLVIPRRYSRPAKAPTFAPVQKVPREDRLLMKVFALLVELFTGVLSRAQIAYVAASVVEQKIQNMQRIKAIRAQNRALRKKEEQLKREAGKTEGKEGAAGDTKDGQGGRKKTNWRMRGPRKSYAVSPDDLAAAVGDALAAHVAKNNAEAAKERSNKWRQRYSKSTRPPRTAYTVDEFGNVPTPKPINRPRRARPQKAAFSRFAKQPQDGNRPKNSPNT